MSIGKRYGFKHFEWESVEFDYKCGCKTIKSLNRLNHHNWFDYVCYVQEKYYSNSICDKCKKKLKNKNKVKKPISEEYKIKYKLRRKEFLEERKRIEAKGNNI